MLDRVAAQCQSSRPYITSAACDENISDEPPPVIVFQNPDEALQVASLARPPLRGTTSLKEGTTECPVKAPADQPAPETDAAVDAGGGDGNDMMTVTVPYIVGSHDTFSSVCLKHNMSAKEVMQLNKMSGRIARPGDVLLVWAQRSSVEHEEDERKRLVRAFRRRCKCSNAEAAYYLDSHDYDFAAALATRQHELSFEREYDVVLAEARKVTNEAAAKTAAVESAASQLSLDRAPTLRGVARCVPSQCFAGM